ncbi:Zeaxanthin epoxidase [Forsythia ovata]|uniref:Zeaxanthin epoxidase n=1 Tax=Forsythia ovata TaxID=205694 RepID=A0ABD1S2K0_9LAMI
MSYDDYHMLAIYLAKIIEVHRRLIAYIFVVRELGGSVGEGVREYDLLDVVIKFFRMFKLVLHNKALRVKVQDVLGVAPNKMSNSRWKRLGIRSLVLESLDHLRITGVALTMCTNAWRTLDALGIGDYLKTKSVQIQGYGYKSVALSKILLA